MKALFECPIRAYYEDTDAGGVVYYANYLKFAERGRTELLRSMGFENKSLLDQFGVVFVVRHLEADYIRSAYLDDLLTVETAIIEVKNASVLMRQSIKKNNDLIFRMDITLACVNTGNGKPAPFPESVKKAFVKGMKN